LNLKHIKEFYMLQFFLEIDYKALMNTGVRFYLWIYDHIKIANLSINKINFYNLM